MHLHACPYIPNEVKRIHSSLKLTNTTTNVGRRKLVKYLKAYYVEAARELGLVDTPRKFNGMVFGNPPNTSDTPSEKLLTLMEICNMQDAYAANEALEFLINSDSGSDRDRRIENMKFFHIATPETREVIERCRKTDSHFVHPSDFSTWTDFRFVLYQQFWPCRPHPSTWSRKESLPDCWATLSGLYCKVSPSRSREMANKSLAGSRGCS